MTTPRVTVLTAVRNGAGTLDQTITCIQAQTFSDWEYILVDDASDDGTPEVLARHARADARLSVIRRDTAGGPYVAANDGLAVARGEYIVRIDADDLSPPERIERQLAWLAEHSQYRACVTFWRTFDQTRGLFDPIRAVPVRPRVFRWYLLFTSSKLHSSLCIQRAALHVLGGYQPLPLSQDYRLWCDLTRRDWLGILPEPLSYVRYHPQRVSVSALGTQRQLALDVLRDHLLALAGERWGQADIETLYAVGHGDPLPVNRGLEMLGRWTRLWRAAHDLTAEDQRDLARLGAYRRWLHLRNNAVRQPLQAGFQLLAWALTAPGTLPRHLRGPGLYEDFYRYCTGGQEPSAARTGKL